MTNNIMDNINNNSVDNKSVDNKNEKDINLLFDLTDKKKHKQLNKYKLINSNKFINDNNDTNDTNDKFINDNNDNHNGSKKKNKVLDVPDYQYRDLLLMVYKLLDKNSTGKYKTTKIKSPKITKIGIQKIIWTNFNDICISLNRDINLVHKFFLNELNSNGFINDKQNLIIKGNFTQNNIENILKKYIINFVQCSTCLGIDTTLKKDVGRIHIILCLNCNAVKNVRI